MGKYAQLITSFERSSNFPLEADYIFATEKELLEFYNKPENKALLHEGLLKVVKKDSEGNQSLYWAILEPDTNELVFRKLLEGNNSNWIDVT